MNDEKPNTAAQKEVDKILENDRDAKAQKEIDASVKEMRGRPDKGWKGETTNPAQQAAQEDLQRELDAQGQQKENSATDQDNAYDYGMSQ